MTVPAGYTALVAGARRAIVRDDLVPALGPWLVRMPLAPPAGATPLGGGRGATFRVVLGAAGAVVLRFGRRGGIVGRLVRDHYLGVRPRPWRELAVSLAARERGAPVPEVVAVGVHGWGIYRTVVVTGELPDVRPLLAALQAAPPGGARATVARAAGAAVAELHEAGVAHPDLNLSNIVVGNGAASIVDLDRARLAAGGLADAARRRSLRRLARSARKLDPFGRVVDAEIRRSFHDAYDRGRGRACGS